MKEQITVLTVDDFEPNLYLLSNALERQGFRVVSAASGEEGLRKVVQDRPDIVILDVNMPDVSGLEVCRKLKAGADTAKTPVIMISAVHQESAFVERGLAAGAEAYLFSPIDEDHLAAVVRGTLAKVRNKG